MKKKNLLYVKLIPLDARKEFFFSFQLFVFLLKAGYEMNCRLFKVHKIECLRTKIGI